METDWPDFFGRMSPEFSATKPTPSDVSWEHLSGTMTPWSHRSGDGGLTQVWLPGQGHGSLGGFSTVNISECPNDAVASTLSQILEADSSTLQPYFLSQKACAGILRRTEAIGKTLPEPLARALMAAADLEPIST